VAGNVLFAAPSYAGKSFALSRWCAANRAAGAAYESQYGGKTDILIVDNTAGSDGYAKLCAAEGIRAVKVSPGEHFEETFHLCWQVIHQESVIEGWDYVFSVEADNIIPPSALCDLMRVMDAGKMSIVTHTYPYHLLEQHTKGRTRTSNPRRFFYNELGICLMEREVLSFALADKSRYDNVTNAIFYSAQRYMRGWATCTRLFDSEHLECYEEEYQQFLPEEEGVGRRDPYDHLDASDMSQKIPECVRADYEAKGILRELEKQPDTDPRSLPVQTPFLAGGNGSGDPAQVIAP